MRTRFRGVVTGAVCGAMFFLAFPVIAQLPPQNNQQPPNNQQTQSNQPPANNSSVPPKAEEKKPGEQAAGQNQKGGAGQQDEYGKTNDRIFGVIPNYLTVEGARNIKPISPKEKFKLAFQGIRDPYAFIIAGAISGVSQARNETPSWGQGWVAYTRRYWAQLADQDAGPIMSVGLFPSLFHQDPRYFQLGRGSFIHRFSYALSRLFVTRTDSGRRQFNYSEFVGNAAAAGISNLYYPKEERTLGHNMSEYGMQIAIDLLGNEMKEFWPDIRRKFTRQK